MAGWTDVNGWERGVALRYCTIVLFATIFSTALLSSVAWAIQVTGTEGSDILVGTKNADTLNGKDGDDTISGLAAYINGINGSLPSVDHIYGGNGDDFLYGSSQTHGGQGGADIIYGEAGNDMIVGSDGQDNLQGGLGNDTIATGSPADKDVDSVSGGDGDDEIYAISSSDSKDSISCGAGSDAVYADPFDVVASDCEHVQVSPALADVAFTQPVTLQEVVQLGQENNADISVLYGKFQIGGRVVHDLYSGPTTNSATELEQSYKEDRLNYFKDTIVDIEQMKAADREQLASQLSAMKTAVENDTAPQATATEVTFSGELSDLQDIEVGNAQATSQSDTDSVTSSVASVQIIEASEAMNIATEQSQSEPIAQTNDSGTIVQGSTDGLQPEANEPSNSTLTAQSGTFYPNHGYSRMRQSWEYPDRRFTGQYFEWNNNTLNSDDTYEHDVFLDFRDGKSYMTRWMTTYPGCYPIDARGFVTAPANSRPYYDTNFNGATCANKFKPYTIGFLNAGGFQNNVMYQTYLRTSFGNAAGDGMIVQAQKGYRRGCYLYNAANKTFCSFGDARRSVLGRLEVPDGEKVWYGVPTPGERFWEWRE